MSDLSGRSLRRTLRVQVVAGDARASSPRAPCRLTRVSMKPRCRLHEPIRFINCSTSSFYSSIFIQIRGICVPIRKRKISLERGAGSLIKRKQSQKTRSPLLRFSVTSALAGFSFWALREGGRSLDESALSGFAAPTTHICLVLAA